MPYGPNRGWEEGRERSRGAEILARGVLALVAALAAIAPAMARAEDAEIVLLIGKGDARETADAPWRPAAVKQKLAAGNFVRTGEMSQMGLLLRDRTQVRLSQLSILNIKAVNAAAPPPPTQLELPQGRAWSQAKPRAPDASAKAPARLNVTMPGGTAAIRGTDWELVVEKDGTSTVTVFSGQVDFYNEHGAVAVMPNEQARAVPGKAPVKILLTNAAERMQWVTAWRPQPRRWVKDLSGGFEPVVKDIETGEFVDALARLDKLKGPAPTAARAAVLLADLQLYQGLVGDAIGTLAPAADDGRGDPVASALLARAHLVAGDFAAARRVLDNADKHTSAGDRRPASGVSGPNAHGQVEVLLARAEYARLQGDEPGARAAYLEAIEANPHSAEAWYGIGRIETEREYVKAAREALGNALKLQPDGPGYAGELGSLETFANDFPAADKAFRAALERQPDDYVALTGLGVLQLKRGETEAALESFLKAGLIEPRYARAHLFSAVAYYQLGDATRAVEALRKASSLDDKDPLPHLMEGLIHFDALELGRSIESAREAQSRMGYVKSLNQVLTDQRGSANVGSALAAFGMEEWAQAYAYDSYSPYWAGSHLFLADRFSGTYNKNSELFKGFLSDPSVFGASNRFSSLVPVPGHYASLDASARRDYLTEYGVTGAANGYSVALVPFSYSLALDGTTGDSTINRRDADGRMRADGQNLIAGFGIKPTHELGLFAFANHTRYDVHIGDRASGLVDDDGTVRYTRYDVGLNYKLSPVNHVWLKVGEGTERQPLAGAFDFADQLNQRFGTAIFQPGGRINSFNYDQSQRDIQLRQALDLRPGWQLSWGLEHSREGKPSSLDYEVPVVSAQNPAFTALRNSQTLDNRITATQAYVSSRAALAPALDGQLDLFYQSFRRTFNSRQEQYLIIGGVPNASGLPDESGSFRDRELNPRVGLKWRPAPGHTLRLAAQVWRKPPGVNTLAPVDTVGIPLDDQIEDAGGRLRRARLQHEIQFGRDTFAQWFLDLKDVSNPVEGGANVIPDLRLIDLERLRSRRRVYGVRQEFLEETPDFGGGRIRQAGIAVNRLVSRETTVAGRYVYSDTENDTPGFTGLDVPFHPRHYANVGINWQPRPRWVMGPMLTWRSSRWQDEANTERLDSGVAAGFHAYWESPDKRWSAAFVIDNITTNRDSSIYRNPTFQVQGAFRF